MDRDPTPELARLLRLAQRSTEREMMEAAARAGLDMLRPGHMTVLRVLEPSQDGMRTVDIARDADVSRQAVQQLVADLERLGIVEVVDDPQDGRARRVRYTQLGYAGYLRCMEEFVRIERAYEEQLGPRRLSSLKKALRELAG
jgi:DNA-binding MarR family transcriptional regulator